MKKLLNILILLAVIGVGIAVTVFMVKNKKVPEHVDNGIEPTPVETITLQPQSYTPEVTAYGHVEPAVTFQAKAEVSGKISYTHPKLKQGASLKKGTVLVKIDIKDYENSLNQTRADLAANQSQLAQVEQEERNLLTSIDIAQANLEAVKRKDRPVQQNTQLVQQNLRLAQKNLGITQKNLVSAKRNLLLVKKEYNRLHQLAKQRLISQTQVEGQEQKVLQQEQQILQLEQSLVQQQQAIVQQEQQLTQQDQSLAQQDQNVLQQQRSLEDLRGQLKTFASRKASAIAQIKRTEQQIKTQKNQLKRTEIVLPFDARISKVDVDKGEFVGVGNSLFEAINTDGVEIKAELPLLQANKLLSHLNAGLEHDTQALLKQLDLQAKVQLVGANNAVWQARVARFSESVDPSRRTIGITIAVDNPYAEGSQLPLIKGMYAKVTLSTPAFEALVIPRKAVHEGRAYVLGDEDLLNIRPLTIQMTAGNNVVVRNGLSAGEQVVVSDLIPAIPNMPLKAFPRDAKE